MNNSRNLYSNSQQSLRSLSDLTRKELGSLWTNFLWELANGENKELVEQQHMDNRNWLTEQGLVV